MATKTSHLLRPLVALVALVAAMAALLIAYGASPTHAAGSCSATSGTTTCTFGPTGAEDTFEVPAGVNTIHVVATGAPGGVGVLGDAAGRGARVSADLAVSPGQTLYVNVGGTPTGGGNCASNVACNGGFNGGGSSQFGGGGGGASDVRFVSRGQNNSLFSRLIVAAGGGGSGHGQQPDDPDDCRNVTHALGAPVLGGAGGDAGSPGATGQSTDPRMPGECSPVPFTEGGAGTQSGGGAGGETSGQSGSLGQGGGGPREGGGGGGGLFGGGGGSKWGGGDPDEVSTAGGGGGGSNLVFGEGTATLAADTNVAPSVTISYQAGVGSGPSPEKQACQKGGWKELGFKNQGQCIKAVNANN
jgi:Glycine rich protein